MLRYKTETRPGLVALHDIRPGNGAGQFLQPRSPHRAGLPTLSVTAYHTHIHTFVHPYWCFTINFEYLPVLTVADEFIVGLLQTGCVNALMILTTYHNWRAPWKNRIYWYISFFPPITRVLFPMFCLLVEGECQILVFQKYY